MTTYIKELTAEQRAAMPGFAQEWINKGLQTGETDWDTFDQNMPICYEKAGIPYPPRVVRVSSPMVGALAAAVAEGIWKKRRASGGGPVSGAVGDAVSDAVSDAVGGPVRDAVRDAVGGPVSGAVSGAVGDAVSDAVSDAVGGPVDDAVRDAVGGPVSGAVRGPVSGAVRDAVRDAVGGPVSGAVSGAVRGAVGDAVGDAVRDAVGGPVSGAVGGPVDDAVRDAVGGPVSGAVGDAVDDAVRDAVGGPVSGAVRGPVSGAVRDAVRDAVGGPVSGAVRGAVGDAVRDAVRDAVGGPVSGAVGGPVDDAVRDAVGGPVSGAVRDAVGGPVDDAVRDAVGGPVGGAVSGAVSGAVGGPVGGPVDDAVETAISIAKKAGVSLSWHYWLGGQFWVGGWWWGAVASVAFFMDVCKLKLAQDIVERATAYRKVCESVNYIWPNRDFVMVCARPTRIEKDDQGRLHSLTDMAIKYPDGWGLYFIHGVRFEDTGLWQSIASGSISAAEVFAIENMEQRRVAYECMDKLKMRELENFEVLHEVADDGQGYPMRIVSFNLPDFDEPFLYLNCHCPSGGREYYLETRERDCWAAKAASFGLPADVEWIAEY